MKNIVKGLFLAALMCFSFTSCEDEDELPDPGTPSHPETETVGVYTGTWTRQASGKDPETAQGTVTLTATENAYVSSITVDCSALSLNKTTVTNIRKGGEAYIFDNPHKGNAIGAPFSGTISKSSELKMAFQLQVKSGLRITLYDYTFVGSKSSAAE